MNRTNKDVVREHIERAVNGQFPELWERLMRPDFVMHHRAVQPGRDGYRTALKSYWQSFPDLSIEILDLVAEGDRVAARYIERGTHLGEFNGRTPTGQGYEKHGLAIYRVVNSQLAEAWIQEDDLGWARQLGLIEVS